MSSADEILKVLIAMPQLEEEIFRQAVILMARDEQEDQFGIRVNVSRGFVLKAEDFNYTAEQQILLGGPVEATELWALHHAEQPFPDSIALSDSLRWTPGRPFFHTVYEHKLDLVETVFSFGIGYSGWDKGQLSEEINQGYWWEAECPQSVIFGVSPDRRWEAVLSYLGVNDSNQLTDDSDSQLIN